MEKKKKMIAVIVILGVLCIAAYWAMPKNGTLEKSKVFDEKTVEETAEQVVQLLNAGDYETLQDMTADGGKSNMTEEKMEEAKESSGLASDWGNFVEIKEIRTGTVSQRGVDAALVQIVAEYENEEVTYMIAFDENMKLASFGMQ